MGYFYTALCDESNGGYIEFDFFSYHRANSKSNLEDAKRVLRRMYGKYIADRTTIYKTQRRR